MYLKKKINRLLKRYFNLIYKQAGFAEPHSSLTISLTIGWVWVGLGLGWNLGSVGVGYRKNLGSETEI